MTKEKMGCSQEMLKLIACVTMLIDHIGAIFFPENLWFRVVGRIAFPIYCFLLVEGAKHTSNKRKYGTRMFLSLILSEIPFDLAIHGRLTWEYQNIMLTLLLGYWMILLCEESPKAARLFIIPLFAALAELLCTDYGAIGIMTIGVFYLFHDMSMFWTIIGLSVISIFNTAQVFALFAIIPIMAYNGKKLTQNKTVQTIFYLFYPSHLLVLYLLHQIIK